jgi:hypothetical protein
MWVGGQRHAPGRFPRAKEPVSIVQEPRWATGPVWTVAENLAPPGFDPPNVQHVAVTWLHILQSLSENFCFIQAEQFELYPTEY